MVVLPLALGFSFALCLLLTPLAARLARRAGFLDRPDGRRKIHPHPIPLAGGLAIFATLCLILGTVVWWTPETLFWFADTNLSLPGLLGRSEERRVGKE